VSVEARVVDDERPGQIAAARAHDARSGVRGQAAGE
jgi:hypothetical protein